MDGERDHRFRWYWAWQDDREEAWLREMAQSGWHLQHANLPCFYTFQRGEPQDVIYRLDYIDWRVDRDEYFQIFQDAGWEHVGAMAGWQYFRSASKGGEAAEIYTDPESKVRKYHRLLAYLFILTPIFLTQFPPFGEMRQGLLGHIFGGFMILFFLLYIYAMVRIWLRVHQLRRL